MRAFFETLNHFKDLLTLLLASMGGAFALWRWMVEQKWRRVQHAQSLIKTFHERPNTIKAFEIILETAVSDLLPTENRAFSMA